MFKEQYIRDNEKTTAKETLLMEIKKKALEEETRREKQQARNRSFVRWGAVAAALLLVLGGALGVALNARSTSEPVPMSASADTAGAIASYDDVYALIETLQGENGAMIAGEKGDAVATAEAAMPAAEMAMDSGAVSTGGGMKGDYSETNVQVRGVDEADIVKTDGEYIYYTAENMLYIVRADGEKSELLSRTEMSATDEWWGYGTELFLLGDRLMVVTQGSSLVWINDGSREQQRNTEQTRAAIYDVSDPKKPALVTSLGQSGNYVSSRMIGDYVYLVTAQYVYSAVRAVPETYIPTVYENDAASLLPAGDILTVDAPKQSTYTVIGSIDLKSGVRHASVKALFGGASELYANSAHLLLAIPQYDAKTSPIAPDQDSNNVQVTTSASKTKLVLFSLEQGSIARLASGTVNGTLLNQFAMDEYKDAFRVVTTVNEWEERIYTDGVDRYEYDSSFYNCLYTLDASLNVIGKLEKLAEDETVQSVRFDGDIGYFVTFRQIDPLFAVDLSDASRPRVLSSLKIPGFSEYLHLFTEGRLLGLGYEADEDSGATQGVKLSMFDVSDKTDVREITKTVLDAGWTVVGSNHKAILVSAEKNLIAFPADSSYYVYRYNEGTGFEQLAVVGVEDDLYSWNLRGLYIGNYLYILSESGVSIVSLADFERVGRVKLG